jgi:hypothetical protein
MRSWTLAAAVCQSREAEQRPTLNREQNMAWIVSTVQSISLEAPELPGFFVGQSTSSAELTLVFEDAASAEGCANAMKGITDHI